VLSTIEPKLWSLAGSALCPEWALQVTREGGGEKGGGDGVNGQLVNVSCTNVKKSGKEKCEGGEGKGNHSLAFGWP